MTSDVTLRLEYSRFLPVMGRKIDVRLVLDNRCRSPPPLRWSSTRDRTDQARGTMSHIKFREEHVENLVAGHYSTGRGQVLRSDTIELTKIRYNKGFGADTHQHPEEQVLYVLEGCLRFTVADQTYDVSPGEGSFHESDVPHSVVAIEDTVALSFKNQVAPTYDATGRLGE